MKEFKELLFKEALLYTEDHEWVNREGQTLMVGVTDYAQDQLGDIVFVEMPEVGESFSKGDEFGSLESVKAVSEIYLPVSGEIVEINDALADAPELINQDAYLNWIVKIKPADRGELDQLLTPDQYRAMLEE